jgi:predicted PurR-regulated permease PerM
VLQSTAVAALVVVALLCAWYAADGLLVIFAGILLAIFLRGLSAGVAGLTGIGRGWALTAVVAALVGLIVLGYWLLAPEVGRQAGELARSLPESWSSLQRRLSGSGFGRWLLEQASGAEEWVTDRRALGQATSILSTTAGALVGILIVLALGIYFAAEPAIYLDGALRLVPPARRGHARDVLLAIGDALTWWLIGRFIGMAIIGVLTWLGLLFLGVPLALTLALIAAALTFLPNIGPVVSAVPAVLLALMQGPAQAGWVVVLYTAIQLVESYLLTPLVQRRTLRMPPALTLSAQIVLGTLFGIAGLALATPLVAAAIVVVQKLYVEEVLEEGGEAARAPEG